MTHPRDNPPTPLATDLHLWTAAYDCTMHMHELGIVCPVGSNHTKARNIILGYLVKVVRTERKRHLCELLKQQERLCTPSRE